MMATLFSDQRSEKPPIFIHMTKSLSYYLIFQVLIHRTLDTLSDNGVTHPFRKLHKVFHDSDSSNAVVLLVFFKAPYNNQDGDVVSKQSMLVLACITSFGCYCVTGRTICMELC